MSRNAAPERLACLEINEFTAMVAWTSSMRAGGGILLDETEEFVLEPSRPAAAVASWLHGKAERRPARWAVTVRPKRRRLGVGRGLRTGPERWAEAVQALQGRSTEWPGSLSVGNLDGRASTNAAEAESLLMVSAPRDGMEALILPLLDGLPAPMHIAPASFCLIGALTRAARLPGVASRPDVMVWDTGEFESHLILVGADGAPACVRVPFGIEPVIEAVQSELGLRLRGAAAKLLFGEAFDFGDMAPRLAGLMAGKLQPFVKLLVERAGRRPAALLSAGLASRHRWLDAALAAQLGLEPYLVDAHAWGASVGLSLKDSQADGVTPCWLGLLDYATALSRQEGVFPEWQDGQPSGEGNAVVLSPTRIRLTSLSLPAVAPDTTPAEPVAETRPRPAPVVVEPESAAFAPTPGQASGARRTRPMVIVEERPAAVLAGQVLDLPVGRDGAGTEDKPTRTPWGEARAQKSVPPPAPPTSAREVGSGTEFQPGTPRFHPEAEAWDGPLSVPARRALLLTLLSVVLAIYVVHEYRLWPLPEPIEHLPSISTLIASTLPAEDLPPLPARPAPARVVVAAVPDAAEIPAVDAMPDAGPVAVLQRLETRPSGAAVLIGDLAAAESPVDLSGLAPGRYASVARLPGYGEYAFELVIEPDGTFRPTVVDLRSASGAVRIDGPAGATYTLYPASGVADDAVVSGPLPAVLENVPAGRHRLEVVRSGWATFQADIEVRAGEQVDVVAEFQSGAVVVETVPAGAEVRGLEQVFGTTPVTLEGVPTGRLALVVRRPGFLDETVEVDVEPGGRARVELALRPDDRPFDLAAVDERPEPLVLTRPTLSDDLHRRGGQVVLSFIVDREGRGREFSVVETTSAPIASAVLRVAPSWRFRPARVGGEAVNVRVELPISIPARP